MGPNFLSDNWNLDIVSEKQQLKYVRNICIGHSIAILNIFKHSGKYMGDTILCLIVNLHPLILAANINIVGRLFSLDRINDKAKLSVSNRKVASCR